MNNDQREQALTRELLEAIDDRSDVTQRHLADRLGIALGLANAYLKRCIRKGLVKVQQAPANRYLYYLTPMGFAEKSRLTAVYLRDSFDFYRRASASISRTLAHCQRSQFRRVVVAGASELAEIALVRVREYEVTIVSLYDPAWDTDTFLELPVARTPGEMRDADAAIVTSIVSAEETYREMLTMFDPDRVLVPDILGINADGA